MTAAAPPILHILAGPNGAGKTSLYEARIVRLTDAEYVNADRLSRSAAMRPLRPKPNWGSAWPRRGARPCSAPA